jgi:hypothetical protein
MDTMMDRDWHECPEFQTYLDGAAGQPQRNLRTLGVFWFNGFREWLERPILDEFDFSPEGDLWEEEDWVEF